MARKMIDVHGTTMDLLVEMSKGNPGAVSVLAPLLQKEDGLMDIMSLDDMNMRGSQIWLGYKDYAGCDIEKFQKAIKDRSPEMIRVVNKVNLLQDGERAVASGGSLR